MKILVKVSTDKLGSECETEIEVDDEISRDGLEEAARDAMFGMISWTFSEVEP